LEIIQLESFKFAANESTAAAIFFVLGCLCREREWE